MNVEIMLDNKAIQELEKAVIEAAKSTMDQVLSDVKNTVPLDQGGLQNSMYVDTRKINDETHVFIDHDCKYARYLYFGNKMVDRETGKGPMLIHDKNGGEVGLRYRKGAKLKVKKPEEKLKIKGGRSDHWFEPYISGEKKYFVIETFKKLYKEKTGV